MKPTAAARRVQMQKLAQEAGFQKVRFGLGSAPKNRLYFRLPSGQSSFADNITDLRSQIEASGIRREQ